MLQRLKDYLIDPDETTKVGIHPSVIPSYADKSLINHCVCRLEPSRTVLERQRPCISPCCASSPIHACPIGQQNSCPQRHQSSLRRAANISFVTQVESPASTIRHPVKQITIVMSRLNMRTGKASWEREIHLLRVLSHSICFNSILATPYKARHRPRTQA